MANIGLVLLVFGFVCAVIACFQAAQPWWNKLVAAAIAFMIAAELFGGLSSLHIIH